MHISLLLFVSFCLTSTSAGSSVSQDRPSATIDSGVVVGTSTAIPPAPHKIDKFLGVPFAAPLQRFSPPQKETPWQGIYDASTHKPACIQQFDFPEEDRARIIKWLTHQVHQQEKVRTACTLTSMPLPKGKSLKQCYFGSTVASICMVPAHYRSTMALFLLPFMTLSWSQPIIV